MAILKMNKEKANKSEAREELIARENAIADAVACSLVKARNEFVRVQRLRNKHDATAGQLGGWWISCLMVRENLSLDEAFTIAKKELKKLNKIGSDGQPERLERQVENYRPLVPHAYSIREARNSDPFDPSDDEFPANAQFLPVSSYRDYFKIAETTAGDAVGDWEWVEEQVNELAIEPFLVSLTASGLDPKKATLADKLAAVKTAANKIRKASSNRSDSLTPEDHAMAILKKDETRLALISRCGPDLLKQIEITVAQVRASIIDAAKRSS